MERACGAAFLQCRFMNPFGNVCQRHHAAEGEGQYEDAEKDSADVVPVIPSFSVGGELGVTVTVCFAPYIYSYPDAGNDHETTQGGEPDDSFGPKDGILPQPGEVYPVDVYKRQPAYCRPWRRCLLVPNLPVRDPSG